MIIEKDRLCNIINELPKQIHIEDTIYRLLYAGKVKRCRKRN